MSDIPALDLRNNMSGVLRRVEAGERLRVTVSGRPVAELAPLPRQPVSLLWEEFIEGCAEWRADAALAGQLQELLPDSTDHDSTP